MLSACHCLPCIPTILEASLPMLKFQPPCMPAYHAMMHNKRCCNGRGKLKPLNGSFMSRAHCRSCTAFTRTLDGAPSTRVFYQSTSRSSPLSALLSAAMRCFAVCWMFSHRGLHSPGLLGDAASGKVWAAAVGFCGGLLMCAAAQAPACVFGQNSWRIHVPGTLWPYIRGRCNPSMSNIPHMLALVSGCGVQQTESHRLKSPLAVGQVRLRSRRGWVKSWGALG
jgi:hypothetical protein